MFEGIHLNEEETTSSSRIFLKVLFQEISEAMGVKSLKERLKDPYMAEHFKGLFPKDNPRDIRFAINYFTSIGLGAVTYVLLWIENVFALTLVGMKCAKFSKTCQSCCWPRKWHRRRPPAAVMAATLIPRRLRVAAVAVVAARIAALPRRRRRLLVRLAQVPEASARLVVNLALAHDLDLVLLTAVAAAIDVKRYYLYNSTPYDVLRHERNIAVCDIVIIMISSSLV